MGPTRRNVIINPSRRAPDGHQKTASPEQESSSKIRSRHGGARARAQKWPTKRRRLLSTETTATVIGLRAILANGPGNMRGRHNPMAVSPLGSRMPWSAAGSISTNVEKFFQQGRVAHVVSISANNDRVMATSWPMLWKGRKDGVNHGRRCQYDGNVARSLSKACSSTVGSSRRISSTTARR